MTTSLAPFETRMPGLFSDLRRDVDNLMDRFFERGNGHELASWFKPSINLAENDKQYEVTVDLPGIKPDEFDVELKHGDLWITGERKEESEEKGKKWHRLERRYGQFRRVIRLGEDVDAEQVDAEYKDGVLRIIVPKTENSQTKHIKVKS